MQHPIDLGVYGSAAVLVLGLFSIWANYDADRQRHAFRQVNRIEGVAVSVLLFVGGALIAEGTLAGVHGALEKSMRSMPFQFLNAWLHGTLAFFLRWPFWYFLVCVSYDTFLHDVHVYDDIVWRGGNDRTMEDGTRA